MSVSESQKLVRSELNIERFMFWVTSNSTKQSHRVERTVQDGQGNRQTVAVTVGKYNDREVGVLRTFDLKTFYVLLKHWQELGGPSDGPVPFVIHDLAQRLNLSWSGRTSKMLKASLERLKFIPLKWENSYLTKETGVTEKVLSGFTILSHLTLHERTKGEGAPTVKCAFRFDDRIIRNMQQNYSKPLRLNEMLSLKSELALMLYTRLDLWLSKTTMLEKNLDTLVSELGLDLNTYPYPSQRKRLFAAPVAELVGRELSTGVIARAEILPTADGDEFKLSVRKVARGAIEELASSSPDESSLDFELVRRGVSRAVAKKLMQNFDAERISKQIKHFDWLSTRSKIKSSGGWLKLAIESDYALPEDMNAKEQSAKATAERASSVKATEESSREEAKGALLARQARSVDQELWKRIEAQFAICGMSRVGQGVASTLVLTAVEDSKFVFEAPSAFERDFIRDHHFESFHAALSTVVGTNAEVAFVLDGQAF